VPGSPAGRLGRVTADPSQMAPPRAPTRRRWRRVC